MKTYKLINLLTATLILGFVFTGCKKTEDKAQITDQATIATVQDDESQDAIADNATQSIDDVVDALEANDFSGQKSAATTGYRVTIDHPDTTTFPKVITIVFDTDTVLNDETFKQSGTITITLSLQQNKRPWRNYIKRSIAFEGYKVECDSASVEINGSRTMTRKSVTMMPQITPNNIETVDKFRLQVVDQIVANFSFIVKVGDAFTDTFTRVVDHTRTAIPHFKKVPGTIIFRQVLAEDTLKMEGSVTGKNFRGLDYSRVITSPLLVTRCSLLAPVISSGVIAFTNGVKSGTITYTKEGCRTVVTIESDGKVKEISRKMNRRFHHWW